MTATSALPIDLYAWPRTRWERHLAEHGAASAAATHARTLFRQAYKAASLTPWDAPSLPKAMASSLAASTTMTTPRIRSQAQSGYDGAVKLLLELDDGAAVESVLMPEKQRITLCVSSQVGCRQACVFCHTGRMGLLRQLTAGEIVAQVMTANRWLAEHPEWLAEHRFAAGMRVTNIVFMGMGEPLDNVEAVIDALGILTDPYGLALGTRRISVSTAGHLDGIERLLDAVPGVRLALSVHTVDDGRRSRIMPINRRWPLSSVIARLVTRLGPEQRPVMLQYTMIAGVNDSLEEAAALAELTRGLNAKINLIPLNEVGPSRLTAPTPERIQAFRDVLHAAGLRVMVRYSKGQDIAAACGQLVVAG